MVRRVPVDDTFIDVWILPIHPTLTLRDLVTLRPRLWTTRKFARNCLDRGVRFAAWPPSTPTAGRMASRYAAVLAGSAPSAPTATAVGLWSCCPRG